MKRSKFKTMVAAIVCGVVVLAGCGGSGSGTGSSSKYANTPTGAVQEYLDLAKEGKFEKAAKCLYFKKEKTDAELKEVAKLVDIMVGHVKNYEIISEKISENWFSEGIDKGEVMVKFIKDDGKEGRPQKLNTIKVDGKWKMDSGN